MINIYYDITGTKKKQYMQDKCMPLCTFVQFINQRYENENSRYDTKRF